MSARTIVLHIGPHKTGSTAIQLTLTENRPILERAGFSFPEAGYRDIGHHDLAKAMQAGATAKLVDFAAELNRVEGNFVLSSEDFSSVREPELRAFFSRIESKEVRVIFYLRSFLPLLFSFWQEETKHGRHRSFLEFCTDYLTQPFASHTLNPLRLLQEFATVFGREAITVYRYDQIMGARRDVSGHFMNDVLGVRDYEKAKGGERHNVRFAPALVELMRRLNSAGLKGMELVIQDRQIRPLLLEVVQKSPRFVGALNLSYDMFLFAYLERELIEQWGDRIVGFDRTQSRLFEELIHIAEFTRPEIWAEEQSLNQAFQLYVDRMRATSVRVGVR